jgi:hypothetical protein
MKTTLSDDNDAAIARVGWSIPEWCARIGRSRFTWYRMPPHDRPVTIPIGGRAVITVDADREWRREQLARAKAKRHALLEPNEVPE